MNRERIALLVQRLRSGEYKQCRYSLREDDRFCFEGVMCDVSGVGEWDKVLSPQIGDIKNEPRHMYVYKDKTGSLGGWLQKGDSVLNWYGLMEPIQIEGRITNGLEKGQKSHVSLNKARYFNDHEDWSFGRLAAAIEEKYLTEVGK